MKHVQKKENGKFCQNGGICRGLMRLMDSLSSSGTALPGVCVLSGASEKRKQGSALPEDGSRERSKRSSRCFYTSISSLVALIWPEIRQQYVFTVSCVSPLVHLLLQPAAAAAASF